jgi:hypothetical protein
VAAFTVGRSAGVASPEFLHQCLPSGPGAACGNIGGNRRLILAWTVKLAARALPTREPAGSAFTFALADVLPLRPTAAGRSLLHPGRRQGPASETATSSGVRLFQHSGRHAKWRQLRRPANPAAARTTLGISAGRGPPTPPWNAEAAERVTGSTAAGCHTSAAVARTPPSIARLSGVRLQTDAGGGRRKTV